jgi:shikimate kinase
MNLVLIGYRAAGKTTVGRRLSTLLQRAFADSDEMIVRRQKMSIEEIVRCHGWAHFRTIEREVISELSNHDHLIISAGGGVPIDPENVRGLRKNGLLIWLKADVEVLLERMSRDIQSVIKRPSLTGKGTLKEFKEVLIEREPLYARTSEFQVDTSLLDVDGVVSQILTVVKERAVRT